MEATLRRRALASSTNKKGGADDLSNEVVLESEEEYARGVGMLARHRRVIAVCVPGG